MAVDSDLRLLPPELAGRSISNREIVLAYADALLALDHLERAGHHVLAWEGWLRWPDGRLGHSARHQGTEDLSKLSPAEAATFCRKTMAIEHENWRRAPESPGVELYFCICIARIE